MSPVGGCEQMAIRRIDNSQGFPIPKSLPRPLDRAEVSMEEGVPVLHYLKDHPRQDWPGED
jgi:hypothetical protein